MSNWLMSATGATTTFIAGIVIGALLTHWRSMVKGRSLSTKRSAPPMLWDIHCVLNAMNKMALTAERGRPVEPAMIYLLSDYLLHSALLQREDGWTDRDGLENWLLAHVRVVADHRGQATLPGVTVEFPKSVRRVHAKQLLRQLLWNLQVTQTINRVHIQLLGGARGEDRLVKVRLEVEGDLPDPEKITKNGSSSSSWQLVGNVSTCELRAAFEAEPA
ncbi:MAG: hypothetical protein AB7S86_19110 [Hydrogenophaga sp.]|uniref:hypothetical protein n=1 Tax=Hydrogenophaga sp. TaxID=1904254 RepID=UPI003D121D6A